MYYDRKVNVQQFSPSESVYLLSKPKKGKLAPEYTDPHLVTDTYDNHNVKIMYKRKPRIVHTNKLKKVKPKTHTPAP